VTQKVRGGGQAVLSPAEREDVASFVAIDRTSPKPWPARAFEQELENTPETLFALRHEDKAIGFAVIRFHPPEMDIVNLAVAPEQRRRGFGRILLGRLIEKARRQGVRRIFLEVREGNLEAVGLYQGLGFEDTQRRKNFYLDPVEDARLMSLEIEP
jgi:ribosomal-protein-alanine N-acetyltransferase